MESSRHCQGQIGTFTPAKKVFGTLELAMSVKATWRCLAHVRFTYKVGLLHTAVVRGLWKIVLLSPQNEQIGPRQRKFRRSSRTLHVGETGRSSGEALREACDRRKGTMMPCLLRMGTFVGTGVYVRLRYVLLHFAMEAGQHGVWGWKLAGLTLCHCLS